MITSLALLFCSLSLSTAIRCYVGEQIVQNGVLQRETVGLAECPAVSYCVKQEWELGGITTRNFLCDRTMSGSGMEIITCSKDGSTNSVGLNNIQCTNTCCSSDYCNLPTSDGNRLSHFTMLLTLCALYVKLDS
ncbi:hypothetical protein Q1695_015816 [Nippostrongylus brasiliensis]|nr:hypothetical protein Q1695_015816 [Nippostrongylus brasiliensis]